jgi:hypothetical protein
MDISYFLDDFFLANTPGYLLRKTLANPRLDSVLDEHTDAELEQLVSTSDSADALPSQQALGYVALIALLKRGNNGAVERIMQRTLSNLRWVPSIVAEWEAARNATTYQTVQLRPPGIMRTNDVSPSSNTTTILTLDSTLR